jgi:hypothetical protein
VDVGIDVDVQFAQRPLGAEVIHVLQLEGVVGHQVAVVPVHLLDAAHLVVEPIIVASLGAIVVGRDHLARGVVATGDGADGGLAILPELVCRTVEPVEDVLDDFDVCGSALGIGAYSTGFDFERRAR